MNTYQTLKLNDETEVKLTLTFGLLYKLKVTDEKLYDECNKILMNGAKDLFDMVKILYVAYKCGEPNGKLTYNEFMELVPFDLKFIPALYQRLATSKKK